MKLLLQRNVQKVGKIGDIVEVKDGYARNFLLPRGYGVEVTKDNLNRFASTKRRLIQLEQETKEKFQVLAKEIEQASCTIIANSSEEGHLYGSVTARDIARQLSSEGLAVEPDAVLLDKPIKELGIYKVTIRLHAEVECEAKVWVVKGDDAGQPPRQSGEESAGHEDDDDDEGGLADEYDDDAGDDD